MRFVLIEFRKARTPYPVHLANALSQLGECTLMLPEESRHFSDTVDQTRVNLEFFHLPRFRQPSNLAMVKHLRQRLKALKPDLVHITFWHMWGTPGLGLFASFPLVTTVHDVSPHPGDHGWQSIPSSLYPWQWRWADQVIVHAAAARQQLLTQYNCSDERVHLIPIGSYDFYRTYTQATQPERAKTILFFGRIWPYKGLQYLIEAEPLITEAVPEARIIIAGQGESFEKYRQAMINPDHFEVYNQHISDNQVAGFFQQASIVVLPYVEASQSGVVSVAYAFGKPVVSTAVGGLPDVVLHGQTGLLVPPADARSLAEAIITLLKDEPLRRKMGQCAQHFAETELSWSHIAQKTLNVYQQAVIK
ncbi:MAG: glycosyltransferase family 4 protein [Anaerolineae bacterium]|nr:glycosyltransferase family 4 protein [Anaerolineae bacterium]